MKCKPWAMLAAVLCLSAQELAAQELLVDQASGTLEEPVVNSLRIPGNQLAQSFTPFFSSVGFVQLRSLVPQPSGSSVTVVVNLRQGAYDGPVLSSTDPVIITGFADVGTFYFSDNIPIAAGQMYFFEPVLQSLGSLEIGFNSPSTYDRGDLISNGVPSGGVADLWFREGVVVPEPSAGLLFFLSTMSVVLLLRCSGNSHRAKAFR